MMAPRNYQLELCNAAENGNLKKYLEYVMKIDDINKCDPNNRTPLASAVRGGNIQIVQHLLYLSADVNKKCDMMVMDFPKAPVYWAIYDGYLKIAKILLDDGANLEFCQHATMNTFISAVVNGDTNTVESLLKTNIDVNTKFTFFSTTALCWAALFGHLDIVKLLVDAGADINLADEGSSTPLIYAIRCDNLDIAEYLIMKGSNMIAIQHDDLASIFLSMSESLKIIHSVCVDERSDKVSDSYFSGNSSKISNFAAIKYLLRNKIDIRKFASLSKAVLSGYLHVVEYLVYQGCNVNEIDSDGNTPLINAVRIENECMVDELINSKADVCGAARNGTTPLSEAVKLENIYFIKLLLDNGAIPTASTFLNAIQIGNLEIVQFLAKKELVINFICQNEQKPLTKAIESGHIKIAKYLIQHGADPQVIINEPKNSYLMKYVTAKNFEMVKFLIELGAKLELAGDDGCTPLKKAIKLDDFQLVKYFIEKGANCEPKIFYLIKYIFEKKFEAVNIFVDLGINLDLPGDDGFTPLTKSVEINNLQLVKYFIGKGVNINLIDGNNKTALGVAALKRYFSICKILIESGADIELAKPEVVTFSRCNEDFASFLMMHKKYDFCAVGESEHKDMSEPEKEKKNKQ